MVWDASNLPTTGYDIGGVTIKPGGKLTVDGITLVFDFNVGITIEKPVSSPTHVAGGILILKNATLKNKFSGWRWNGITVQGDGTDQLTSVTSKTKPYTTAKWEGVLDNFQSRVIATGTTFTNAFTTILSNNGGIVRVSDGCIFTNCETGININNYTAPTHADYNACYIMNSTFTWDRTFINPSSNPYVGLNLDNLGGGVNIGGCTFQNNDPAQLSYNERGTGILANNVDFNLSKGGDIYCEDASDEGCFNNCSSTTGVGGNGNFFKKLSFGVNYTGNSHHQMAIRNSTFESVLYPIKVSGAVSTAIAKNSFTSSYSTFTTLFFVTPTSPPSPRRYEILLTGTKDATVYKNDITYYNDCYWETSSIIVNTSGSTTSTIKSNTMTITGGCQSGLNSEVNGIEVLNNCSGLEILCNEFINYGVDIRLRSTAIVNDFGTVVNSKPGKNKFSAPNAFWNRTSLYAHAGATVGTYFYNNVIAGNNEIPSTNSLSDIMMNLNNLAGDCSISCADLLALGVDNISNIPNDQIINVYPNPTQGSFNFEIKNDFKFGFVRIYNELAQQINETQLNTSHLYGINLEGQPSGIYTLVFMLDNKTPIVKKIIVQK